MQRCVLHKKRNVAEKVPEHEQKWLKRQLERAWNGDDAEAALRELAMGSSRRQAKNAQLEVYERASRRRLPVCVSAFPGF